MHQQHHDDPRQALLRVCRIGRAQGLRGEVTVQVFSDAPQERFAPGARLYAVSSDLSGVSSVDSVDSASEQAGQRGTSSSTRSDDHAGKAALGARRTFIVQASRVFKLRWMVKFEGVDDRNQAEALNGTVLYGEPESAEMLEREGAFYLRDLIGLQVRLAEGNALGLPADAVIGTVTDVQTGSLQALLNIRLAREALASNVDEEAASAPQTLVPFVQALVPVVDTAQGFIVINPPLGLIPELERRADAH